MANRKKTIKKTKLIKLLSTFSSLEWKRFGRFVQSPFYNTNDSIVQLYTILKKAFPFEVLKQLEEERIYTKLYGTEIFQVSKLRNLCSDLYKLAEDFVIEMHLSKEKRKKDQLLVDALSERNYELFNGACQRLIKEVETQDYLLDSEDFLLLYQLQSQLHHHLESDQFTVDQLALEKSWLNLSSFYEDARSQIIAENHNAENLLRKSKKEKHENKQELRELFFEAADLHQTKQSEKYFKLKAKIFKNWPVLKSTHKTNLLVHLINFSFINEYLQKEFGYQESFELYQIGIRDQLFIINGKMRDVEFLNIALVGIRLKEFDWTEAFVKNHQEYLPMDLRNFLVPLVYAYRANAEKKYELVIELLSQLHPTNQLRYLTKIKNLLIMAYFEGLISGQENYSSALDYEINASKKMMTRNNKLSILKVEANKNFLNLTKKLLALYTSTPINYNLVKSFELLLEETNPLILRHWLQKKIQELKKVASI